MSFTSTPSVRELVDRVCELPCLTLDLGRGLRELGRGNAAAVSANVPFELLLAGLRLHVGAPMDDHLLDDGRTSASAAFASSGVKWRTSCNPMRRWSPA